MRGGVGGGFVALNYNRLKNVLRARKQSGKVAVCATSIVAGRLQANRHFHLRNKGGSSCTVGEWNSYSIGSAGHFPEVRLANSPITKPSEGVKPDSSTALQLEHHQLSKLTSMQALKKLDTEIDPETKNLIINGDRPHLAMALRQLH